ncbi:hypothetical protein SAMN05216323_11122 [Williamwhitmania taraxaci]|uniref:Lipoprotein n=1 Tax=Williamwhitmania taraxaci TaxID=1640674 RepID=A0A1G6T4W7_9BACT|nr:hypothetical protein SAMN05216323_11122 [Williamwhitmania taraxaci]
MRLKITLLQSVATIFVFSLLFGCDPADSRLRIVNNSDTDIYFFYTFNDSLKDLEILRNGYYRNSLLSD